MAITRLELPAEIIIVPDGYKIKSGGIFDLEELYIELVRWFEFSGYAWKETKYRVVELPNGVKMTEIKWECDKKGTDYLSYNFLMYWQAIVSDIEVNVDGVKKKMNKGSIELKFEGKMKRNKEAFVPVRGSEEETKRILVKGGFGKLLWLIYDRIIIKNQVDYWKSQFFGESQKLFDEIKAFLQLYK